MKKYIKILILLFGFFFLYRIGEGVTKMSKSISEVNVLKPQLEYEQFFKFPNLLFHSLTKSSGESYPVSVYTYGKLDFGLMILKKKMDSLNLLDDLYFIDERKSNETNKVYTGFLFNELSYYFEKKETSVNKIKIYIEGFKEDYIKKRTSDLVYISFHLNKTAAILYNESDNVDFQLEKVPFRSKQNNELMILKKNGFVYFFYFRSFREPTDKLMLKDLIKF